MSADQTHTPQASHQNTDSTAHLETPSHMNAPESAHGELRFEQAISELEQVVQLLSQPNVNLDEALSLYERGVNLAQRGRGLIARAETRVNTLRQSLSQSQGQHHEGQASGGSDAPGA